MKKCINETYAACTPTTRIFISIFDDGSTEKQEERYLISEEKRQIERINHCNRDKNGNRYTTRSIINLSPAGWEKWNEEYNIYRYKHDSVYREMCDREATAKHLLHLAECEQHRRDNGEYNRVSATYKQNNINRINHYIELRTEAEKQMPEYKIFIDSMEKSLAILSK